MPVGLLSSNNNSLKLEMILKEEVTERLKSQRREKRANRLPNRKARAVTEITVLSKWCIIQWQLKDKRKQISLTLTQRTSTIDNQEPHQQATRDQLQLRMPIKHKYSKSNRLLYRINRWTQARDNEDTQLNYNSQTSRWCLPQSKEANKQCLALQPCSLLVSLNQASPIRGQVRDRERKSIITPVLLELRKIKTYLSKHSHK